MNVLMTTLVSLLPVCRAWSQRYIGFSNRIPPRFSHTRMPRSLSHVPAATGGQEPPDPTKNAQLQTFDSTYHSPVMWKECISALLSCERAQHRLEEEPTTETSNSSSSLIFVDATLGGGGHSSALLQSLKAGDVVIGCDVDTDALSTACERLSNYLGNELDSLPLFVPVRSNFCELASVLPRLVHPISKKILLNDGLVDGILMDLGVSSHQIDTADRGFAFMKNGPLDMRMTDNIGLNAADICNEFDERELRRILKTYGDEPRAKAIARSIVEHRQLKPLQSTNDLVEAVAAVTPEFNRKSKRQGRVATLARVFQSIRIMVNEEEKVLEQALSTMCPKLIRPGGRLAVLSYHSLEDGATKRMMRDGTVRINSKTNEKDMYGNFVTQRPFRPTKKPQKAQEEERQVNSRARSATLRVAERLP